MDKTSDRIEHLAKEARERYIGSAPLPDPERMIRTMGGDIFDTDVSSTYSVQKTNGGFAVFLPTGNERNRRLRAAQAAGETVIMRGIMSDKDWHKNWDETRYKNGNMQSAINRFATALIMPPDEFKKTADHFTDHDGMCDMKQVAEHFNIATNIAALRAKELGLTKR